MTLGLDVSRWQGEVDWPAVARAGARFAWVKASEGAQLDGRGRPVDYPTTTDQWAGARAAGLACGLYHYARPELSPEVNAAALARRVKALDAVGPGRLPPVLDLEEGPAGLNLAVWARKFVDHLRLLTGAGLVVTYSGASFFQSRVGEGWMDDRDALWIAHYGRPPGQPAYRSERLAVHQYTDAGALPGVAGPVDLNHAVWPLERLTGTPTTEDDDMPVRLAVTGSLPAGHGREVPLAVPPHKAGTARLYVSTGWEVARVHALYFVRDQGPGLSPQDEQWGGVGSFDLVPDDRPSWPLPAGCTQVSAAYDSSHPLATVITYEPDPEA